MSFYQKPENYVKEFVDGALKRNERNEVYFEEMTMLGVRLWADYGVENIIIEAEAPCERERGVEQLKKYLREFDVNIGILIDIPTERYYREYPKPCQDKVGFEVYVRFGDRVEPVYVREFKVASGMERRIIESAQGEFRTALELLRKMKLAPQVARVKPTPEYILIEVNKILGNHINSFKKLLEENDKRVNLYYMLWLRVMELIYGREVLGLVGDLKELYARLTIYVTILKLLGATILEAALGRGRYTIPLRLYLEGHREATRMFWNREALARFNVGYLFERDEYDWVFDPNIAPQLDEFYKDVGWLLSSIDWSQGVELDLLKRIYQNIVPKEVRRQLGEYYTPDWIVQLILWRTLHIIIRGSPPKDLVIEDPMQDIVNLIGEFYNRYGRIPRFVDPTCGSFTFGIHYLSSLIRWYETKRLQIHPLDFVQHIVENVVGIDINPVAVITARVNYLLQVYRLLAIGGSYLAEQPIIPILRLDLLLYYLHRNAGGAAPQRTLDIWLGRAERSTVLRIPLELLGITVNDKLVNTLRANGITIEKRRVEEDDSRDVHILVLRLPQSILEEANITFKSLARALIALFDVGVQGFENELGRRLDKNERAQLENFRGAVLKLEELNLDSIWYSIITNYVLAVYVVRDGFDLVLGNLPWVNVSKYPKGYSDLVKMVAKELDVSPPPQAARKLDISIPLFTISLQYLAGPQSITALMIPASILRGLHGAGWRNLISMQPCRVVEVWDLEDVNPFESVENQPGIVFVVKG
jgi:hypothetical protein